MRTRLQVIVEHDSDVPAIAVLDTVFGLRRDARLVGRKLPFGRVVGIAVGDACAGDDKTPWCAGTRGHDGEHHP